MEQKLCRVKCSSARVLDGSVVSEGDIVLARETMGSSLHIFMVVEPVITQKPWTLKRTLIHKENLEEITDDSDNCNDPGAH